MTADLRPYPEYKESGLPWLGRIPAHWEEKRAKYYFKEVDERSTTGEEKLLSVSHKTGVTPRKAHVTMFMAESNTGHKICRPGDLVINTMWAWMAAMGVARETGLVSPSYGVYRSYTSSSFIPNYLDHLVRVQPYVSEYICRSTGIRASRLRLYPDDFLDIPIACPPIQEQESIVRFIVHNDRRISRFIRNRRRLVEVLNEQKQAIIHQAVTHGIDPNVRLKTSGIEWLVEVPTHWGVGRVKTEMINLNTRRIPLSSTERGKMTLRRYDYYGASGVIDKVDDYLFDDELLLIAEDGANLVLRNLPLAIVARGKFWVNNHAHILKPRRGLLEYFAMLLECIDYSPWISGAAQPKLTQDRLMAIRIPIPPVCEQMTIVSWIKEHTNELNNGIDTARREIDLIQEYRTRLITEMVTGKLDVSRLSPDPVDQVDELEDLNEDMDIKDQQVDEELEALPDMDGSEGK